MRGFVGLMCAATVAALAATGPAQAQEFVAPRFDALDLQLQNLDQREADRLARNTQAARDATLVPQPGDTLAAAQLRAMEAEKRQRDFALRFEQDRAREAREQQVRNLNLPFRRIAPSSPSVVRDPAPFGLPAAPAGHYYARVDGRFVLVDAASELVVRILEPAPAEPRGDQPPGPRPPLEPARGQASGLAQLPPHSGLSSSARVGGAYDPSASVDEYRMACRPDGSPRPDATNPFAAKACPGADRTGGAQ